MLAVAPNLDLVLRDITAADIRPHFQPIVDLHTGAAIGYETLSRGPSPFESPSLLFERARTLGLTGELEDACHTAAFARIAALAEPGREWFINITPEVFCEPDRAAAAAAAVRAHGLEPSAIVFEITERDAAGDHELLQRAIHAHIAEGFRIALDDFGSGSTGLVALTAAMPHVIKLDMELTRGIQSNPYKQSIVRSMALLAAGFEARLVAEGVETFAALETLVRLGVRFAQGRLFGDAHPEPPAVPATLAEMLRQTVDGARASRGAGEVAVSRLATRSYAVQRGSMTCAELETVFHDDPALDCAVVLHGASPVGVISRAQLRAHAGGAAHKPAETIARPLTLVVDENASVVQLATLAMKRPGDDVYEPVIVVRGGGAYHGTVTMRQLIIRAAELERGRVRAQ